MTEFPPAVHPDGDTVNILAAGKRMTFARRAEPALRQLLSGHPANVEEADGVRALE